MLGFNDFLTKKELYIESIVPLDFVKERVKDFAFDVMSLISKKRHRKRLTLKFNEPSSEKANELLHKAESMQEVLMLAKRHGITLEDLKKTREYLFSAENEIQFDRRLMWHSLRDKLRVSHKNRIFWDSDYSDERLAKQYGIHWDELTDSFLKHSAPHSDHFPFWDDGDPNKTSQTDEAANWLWEFYRNGPPPKPDYLKQIKAALAHLIEKNQEEVPF